MTSASRAEAAGYVVLALLFAAAAAFVPAAAVGGLYGWTPALAAGAMTLLLRRPRAGPYPEVGLRRAGWGCWPAAAAVPIAVLALAYAISWLAAGSGPALPAGATGLSFAATAIATIVFVVAYSAGEEIGWRGFLLPRLAALGRGRAALVGGAVWTVWHVPLFASRGIFDGGLALGVAALLAFGVGVLIMSVVANEMSLAGRSVWPATILHGCHNATLGLLATLAAASSSEGAVAAAGLVSVGLYGIVAVAILRFRPNWPAGGPPVAASVRLAPAVAPGGPLGPA